jgi:hypothetical protein
MGGKKSLWAMMESVRGAGSALLNDDSTHVETGSKESEPAVYFDRECHFVFLFLKSSKLILA